jgi:hypothetical protein
MPELHIFASTSIVTCDRKHKSETHLLQNRIKAASERATPCFGQAPFRRTNPKLDRMSNSNTQSPAPSRGDTPSANNLRFTPQLDAEDLLKASTEGLVTLSDFRKRRNNAFEQRAAEGSNAVPGATA